MLGVRDKGVGGSVDPGKTPASTARVQSDSSTPPESTSTTDLKINGSPIGSHGKSNATASGRGKPDNGNGLSSAQTKRKGLRIAAKKHASGEWNLDKVSEVLRNDYGFNPEDMNSREVMDALSLIPVEKQAAN